MEETIAALTKQKNTLQKSNTILRRQCKGVVDYYEAKIKALEDTISCAAITTPVVSKIHRSTKGAWVEILISDLQVGKLVPYVYSTKIFEQRLEQYAVEVYEQICDWSLRYEIDTIYIALLGDLIESSNKHVDSARGTDCTTAEQMSIVIKALYSKVLLLLYSLPDTFRIKVGCVTGNHDWDGHGLSSYLPGKEHLSWVVFNQLRDLTNMTGGRAEFNIAEGGYLIETIQKKTILYEHGYKISLTEAAMQKHKARRGNQHKKYIDYFRAGDKHTVTLFNAGEIVVNGAFFGTDTIGGEYNSMEGYCSVPAQWVGLHNNGRIAEHKIIYL